MKKLLLIPAALVLSTGYAFAVDITQNAHLTQSISHTSDSYAKNFGLIAQVAVPIGVRHGDISQTATLKQSISNTSDDSVAVNKGVVIQAAVPSNSLVP